MGNNVMKENPFVWTELPFKSLTQVYYETRRVPAQMARPKIDEVYNTLRADIEAYGGPPDVWHNVAMVANKCGHDEAEFMFYLGGLHQWPQDVDLLCDALQEYYGSGNLHYNPVKAEATWEYLNSMPREITGPYWRFWVFGSIYHVRVKREPREALALLDEGLSYVRRDGLTNILRNYRAIFVDGTPLEPIQSETELRRYQTQVVNVLEQKLKLGLTLGVEDGYVLALELARLYQERAGMRLVSEDAADGAPRSRYATDDLDNALTYLKLAESLYTGNDNHPLEDIYQRRIHVLMAQGQYGEALRLLRALPEANRQAGSNPTMLRVAALATGERLDEKNEDSMRREIERELRETVYDQMFSNGGYRLLKLGLDNEAVGKILISVAQQLAMHGGTQNE